MVVTTGQIRPALNRFQSWNADCLGGSLSELFPSPVDCVPASLQTDTGTAGRPPGEKLWAADYSARAT